MAATGLLPTLHLPLFHGVQTTGAALPASAAAGTFGMTVGTVTGAGAAGQSAMLVSEVANNNVKTDTVIYDITMPLSDFCGDSFRLTITGLHTRAGGAGTVSVDASVREITEAGVTGADLCITNAQTVAVGATSTAVFTINSTGLGAGDRLLITITAVVTAGDANNNTYNIYDIKLSD